MQKSIYFIREKVRRKSFEEWAKANEYLSLPMWLSSSWKWYYWRLYKPYKLDMLLLWCCLFTPFGRF